ncbi:Por secretion system C-terminal sorting domain-containing protein [Aquimarina amphilecti]|uniref:Por secretion system C-terminal sorting domain-containing protein n=1 Tax=Aquimarina amphilecti TaxID=1038014 RepID=A0A1H7NMQ4_AQUAM|nr:T9SS-dependent M36 family metallopeptidase [Aquimarina amphilecti]SEL24766.1 Por secretion system C-terminal sorting domain-containing protein [Aquimarina amphilecti]
MKGFYFSVLFFALIFNSLEVLAQSSNLQIIKDYLTQVGMSQEDISELRIQRESFSKSLKASNIYVIQEYKEIPIYNAVGSFVVKNGKVLSFSGKLHNDLSKKVNTIIPNILAPEAVQQVASNVGINTPINLKNINKSDNGKVIYVDENLSQEQIPVQLMYVLRDGKIYLCWDMSIYTMDGKHWYSARVNAVTGEVLDKTDWMTECSFEHTENRNTHRDDVSQSTFGFKKKYNFLMEGSYNVYPIPAIESPNHGNRVLITNPAEATASPFGWHDTNGIDGAEFTTTRGNNVIASEDVNANNGIGNLADGGASLVFDFPFNENELVENFEEASITNLFYANNVTHDVWYQYGFDETAGNFQFNNYGRGGSASDEVFADAQDGSGFNNANFGTPPDGANPRMQMFLWNPTPDPAVNTFVVNGGTLSGAYVTVDNSFNPGHIDAPEFPSGLTANLALAIDDDSSVNANDICSNIINASSLNGRIAVVRRGGCNFDDKVSRCQAAGAVAVLVVNNVAGDPIAMGGDDGSITIPAVMIGRDNGEALITEMTSNTINVTLSDIGRNFFAEDSSFDNGIVVHEYGHGISNRLTGGANNSGCLTSCVQFDPDGNCTQATEQMGEGWSDWFALMMTIESGDAAEDSRGIGTYAVGQPTTGGGIRPFPYSTNMTINPVTYADTNNTGSFSAPHGVGSIWASMIWDLTWALIERDGFDPDLYNGTGGNNLAMQLIMDGLKLQSCNPGFVDGRDAILMADEIANSGANVCLIWEVFARRGLGWGATQGDSLNRTDQTEAFDIPPSSEVSCLLNVEDFDESIFRITPNPSSGNFVINVSKGFGESNIRIVDINGRVVFEQDILLNSSYSINAQSLRTGIYILQIMTNEGNRFTTKIAIE